MSALLFAWMQNEFFSPCQYSYHCSYLPVPEFSTHTNGGKCVYNNFCPLGGDSDPCESCGNVQGGHKRAALICQGCKYSQWGSSGNKCDIFFLAAPRTASGWWVILTPCSEYLDSAAEAVKLLITMHLLSLEQGKEWTFAPLLPLAPVFIYTHWNNRFQN